MADPHERRAILEVTPELLRDGGISPLFDAGLAVLGSVAHGGGWRGALVGLVIAGEALPAECAESGPLHVVQIILFTECYGRQRLVRVGEIKLTGKTERDLDGLEVDVRRLRCQPGDTVVLRTPRPLSAETTGRLREQVLYALPDDHGCRVLVLDAGLDLDVIGKDA